MLNKKINTFPGTILLINLAVLILLIQLSLVLPLRSQTIGDSQIKPELITQTGNSELADKIIISHDNKLLASFTNLFDDKVYNVIVWNISDSKILRVFTEKSPVRSITFSPDTKFLVIAEDDFVRLFDVKTGGEIKSFPQQYNPDSIVVFSPDGKKIAIGGSVKLIILNLDTNQALNVENWCYHAKFSPDNKILACQGNGIDLIDSEKGKSVKFLAPGKEIENKHFESINFSPDGKRIAILADDFIDLFDIENGAKLSGFESKSNSSQDFINHNSELAKSDLQSFKRQYKELRSKEIYYKDLKFISNDQFVTLLADRNNENYKISNLFTGENQTLKFKTNPIIEDKTTDIHQGLRNSVFSDDGNFLFFESGLNRFTILDANTGNEIKIIKSQLESHSVTNFFVSPRQKLLVNLNDSGTEFWNLRAGGYWRIPEAKAAKLIDFSSDESLVALNDGDGNIELIDYSNKKRLTVIKAESEEERLMFNEFSPDNMIVALRGYSDSEPGESIKLFDTQNGKLINTITSVKSRFERTSFDPKWKLFAFCESTGDEAQSVKILNIASSKILYTIEPLNQYPPLKLEDGSTFGCKDLKFSIDGQKLMVVTFNGIIRVIDLKSGKQTNVFNNSHHFWGEDIDFSSDSQKIIVDGDDQLTIWDLTTNKITKLPAKPKEKQLTFETGERGSIKIISPDGKILGSIYTANANDWLVTTPNGFFDGTPNFWKGINWRFNNDSFDYSSVETFFNDFFHPNLLQDIIKGQSPQSLTNDEINKKDRRLPKVNITKVNDQLVDQPGSEPPIVKRKATITIEVTDNISEKKQSKKENTSGAKDVRLFRNGSLIKYWHGDIFNFDKSEGCERINVQSNPKQMRCSIEIEISSGQNTFTAYAFNHDNVKSEDATTIIEGADSLKRQGTLYVLAVGVNNYANSAFNLKFAVPDIEAIEKDVATAQLNVKNPQFANVSVISLANENATKANIVSALRKFSGDDAVAANTKFPELDKIKKAQPEDAVIIYFAGHGLAYKDRFYLIPHDGIPADFTKNIADSTEQQRLLTQGKSLSDQNGLNQLFKQSISDLELEDLLENVNAGKLTMVIDACNSGQALESEEKRRGPMNSRGLAQLAYEKGMNILTASQSFQAALEANSLNHGLLTYALLEAFSKGDANNDQMITDREWLDYAVMTVPRLQIEQQNKRLLVQKKESATPNKDADLQTPRIFYRRDEDSKALIISKP